jgi:pentatricopeptide repeat protein
MAAAVADGAKVTTGTYRILMEAAIGAGNPEKALAVFDEVRERKHSPTSAIYALLLTACLATSMELHTHTARTYVPTDT